MKLKRTGLMSQGNSIHPAPMSVPYAKLTLEDLDASCVARFPAAQFWRTKPVSPSLEREPRERRKTAMDAGDISVVVVPKLHNCFPDELKRQH
ncbi:hypothetical protein EYF80_049660 [Liparis tanakae]|uniref:Uncharacterized protein n=1 Tax=Liparis tanakae TaxID=230148 RepID=A0A4Z2FG22_9TELE|nr:hypothetical protein EYF80_049660 [Liparis tanakae]